MLDIWDTRSRLLAALALAHLVLVFSFRLGVPEDGYFPWYPTQNQNFMYHSNFHILQHEPHLMVPSRSFNVLLISHSAVSILHSKLLISLTTILILLAHPLLHRAPTLFQWYDLQKSFQVHLHRRDMPRYFVEIQTLFFNVLRCKRNLVDSF